ncbi:glycosyltransferase family 2 protein [Alphaproteobacteria bacterium]|nr:glycosyltransferase family 2 protein [Alphaproteobacteria bacterium]
MKLFNIIVPVFNESSGIIEFLKSFYSNEIIEIEEFGELIIVNDGSNDDTLEKLEKYKVTKKKVITYSKNCGYGYALNQGIKYSMNKSKYVIFMDSDLTNPISDLKKIINKMKLGTDFIKGNRFHVNGGINQLPINRRFFTRYGNFIARNLCSIKIKDCTNGFRAVKTSLYEGINFSENDFSIIIEEIYLLKNKILSVSEFNTKIGQRKLEQTKSSFDYNINLIFKYFKYSFLSFFKKSNIKYI